MSVVIDILQNRRDEILKHASEYRQEIAMGESTLLKYKRNLDDLERYLLEIENALFILNPPVEEEEENA